ncbi:50S ribosomal protein L21 [Nonlabens sp. Ci31]|jgi:large subunit ribosomal protein L21|uniref:50S ribosomal protein L21 n=1 Tax=Nonlabens sp. Ci31 TaxID=2608253 RepID=UPI0014629EB5|nr:50S ribosomal protein L21 [Nonlabens sp. Ci31]QJP33680.1 50S ribosomal protein L21 [Nonlabens sp. Ci31]
MYAIVEIAGQQFKIEKDQKLFVHRLQEDEGASINIDKVLLLGNGDNITLGAPAIEGAFAEAKVLGHLKGDKVIVFKKKRRKGYRKKNGHRQYLSQIQISSISVSGGKKSSSTSTKTEKATDKKATTKKASKGKVAQKEVEVSENLVTRAEHRSEDNDLKINIDKVLHNIGTATKAEAEDLKLINGIGPAYEKRLNELGIYTYEQISKLKAADREELSAVDGITREKIESEEWVKQAKALLKKK